LQNESLFSQKFPVEQPIIPAEGTTPPNLAEASTHLKKRPDDGTSLNTWNGL